jgi:hypothetical protein
MTPTKTGRGRPKGSGLNDAAQLRAIAGLLAADPALKPTTAIKTLGISDPSVIRRLRDKYHVEAASLRAEMVVHSRPAPTPALPVTRDATPVVAARSAALVAPRSPRLSAIVHLTELPVTLPKAAADAVDPAANLAPPRISESVCLFALSLEVQCAMLGAMFHWPPVVAVVRAQAAFADLALSLSSPFQFSRVA